MRILDVSDNIIEGGVLPPKSVVRHDEDDPYLVVAADKGYSNVLESRKLSIWWVQLLWQWLGDAFASGGSNGYDHKAMGIEGGWESVDVALRKWASTVKRKRTSPLSA